MVWSSRSMFLAGLISGMATFGINAQSVPPPAVPDPGAPRLPQQFAGVWVYNADESINAATGRPERAPRAGAPRGTGAAPTAAGRGTAPAPPDLARAASDPFGDGSRGMAGFGGDRIGPTVSMIQENRSLTRDLLEVPEALTIKTGIGAVTFTDDLQRSRTYVTSGEKQRLQLGAARFSAAATWSGAQFEKKIDAPDGFRMTETYFLSEDGRRMFVIVRVGSTRKGAPVMGVNRVYDRVDQ